MRILLLAIFAQMAFGCECRPVSVREAKNQAEVVFRGTIVGFRSSTDDEAELSSNAKHGWPIAIFRVTRVWKGQVGLTFEMPAIAEGANCFGFWLTFLKVGTDLLVYAYRIDGAGDYITNICNGTDLASRTKHFAQLGPGHEPRKPEQAP
jgi:hypothetical protein